MRKTFYSVNSKWLARSLSVQAIAGSLKTGRPRVPFSECSRRTKQRRVQNIRGQFPSAELNFVAVSSVRQTTKVSSKNIKPDPIEGFSAYEALAFLCRNDFTKAQYFDIRAMALQKGINIYPAYNKIVEAKKNCYPPGMYSRFIKKELKIIIFF